jgi:hypothetical protein
MQLFWHVDRVAAAVLFTPKSGPATRAYLNSKANGGLGFVKARAEDVRTAAADALDRGRQAVKRQADSVVSAIEAGTLAYEEATANG